MGGGDLSLSDKNSRYRSTKGLDGKKLYQGEKQHDRHLQKREARLRETPNLQSKGGEIPRGRTKMPTWFPKETLAQSDAFGKEGGNGLKR